MNNLYISQTNGLLLPVQDNIIEYLYNLSKSLDEQTPQYLCGRLEIIHGYKDAIDFLTGKFHDLYISSSEGPYIRFKDPVVQQKWAQSQGDGIGLTYTKAATITSSSLCRTLFKNNTEITSFDELSLFGITHLEYDSFTDCKSLESIDLQGITTLDANCFSGCNKLTTIKNYQNISSMSSGTFNNCDLTGDFDFSNVTTVLGLFNGDYIGLANNVHLTSIVCPMSAGMPYCYHCTSLTSVTNTSHIDHIREYANFEDCTSLTNIDLPNLITIDSSRAFYNSGIGPNIEFPNLTTINGYGTFSYCNNIKKISLPKLTLISDANFNNMPNVEEIYLPMLSMLKSYMFSGDEKLTKITLGGSITEIPDKTFANCNSLDFNSIIGINWSEVTTVGEWVWDNTTSFINNNQPFELSNCITCKSYPKNVKHLKLPVVTYMGNLIGVHCERIDFNPDVETFNGTIGNAKSLITVTGFSKFTEAKESLFEWDDNLENLDFTNKLKTIGNYAFKACRKLENISTTHIIQPTSIGIQAFSGDDALKSDHLDISLCTIIPNSAFKTCKSLTTINLSSLLTSIGEYAFYECISLNNVIIPASVTSLGNECFRYCNSLSSLTFLGTTPPTLNGENHFTNGHFNLKIYVPSSAVNLYKTADVWSYYESKIYPIP